MPEQPSRRRARFPHSLDRLSKYQASRPEDRDAPPVPTAGADYPNPRRKSEACSGACRNIRRKWGTCSARRCCGPVRPALACGVRIHRAQAPGAAYNTLVQPLGR